MMRKHCIPGCIVHSLVACRLSSYRRGDKIQTTVEKLTINARRVSSLLYLKRPIMNQHRKLTELSAG